MSIRWLSAPAEGLEWIYVPDVGYTSGGVARTLQLVVPWRRRWEIGERWPVVAFIPGAAWQRQEMYNGLPGLFALARRGYAVAAVQVREAALATFPAQMEDVARALACLGEHAEAFHLDMERVALAGDSSGAHLALMAALTAPLPYPVRGVIDLYGPTDMTLCGGRESTSMLGVADLRDDPAKVAAASCATYITPEKAIPPVLIAHGLADEVVAPEHSLLLHERLEACGKACELVLVEGAGHGGSFWRGDDMLDVMDGFLKRLW